jgi:hypothetical protein
MTDESNSVITQLRSYLRAKGCPTVDNKEWMRYASPQESIHHPPIYDMTIDEWIPVIQFIETVLIAKFGADRCQPGTAMIALCDYGVDSRQCHLVRAAVHATEGMTFTERAAITGVDMSCVDWLTKRRFLNYSSLVVVSLQFNWDHWFTLDDSYWHKQYRLVVDDRSHGHEVVLPHASGFFFPPSRGTLVKMMRDAECKTMYAIDFGKCKMAFPCAETQDELDRTCWFALHPSVVSMRRKDDKVISDPRRHAVQLGAEISEGLRVRMERADSRLAGGKSVHSAATNLTRIILSMMHAIGWKTKKRKLEL